MCKWLFRFDKIIAKIRFWFGKCVARLYMLYAMLKQFNCVNDFKKYSLFYYRLCTLLNNSDTTDLKINEPDSQWAQWFQEAVIIKGVTNREVWAPPRHPPGGSSRSIGGHLRAPCPGVDRAGTWPPSPHSCRGHGPVSACLRKTHGWSHKEYILIVKR